MSTDPRSLNYPSLDDRDRSGEEFANSTDAGSSSEGGEHADRRSGSTDEVKELDRTERRKPPARP